MCKTNNNYHIVVVNAMLGVLLSSVSILCIITNISSIGRPCSYQCITISIVSVVTGIIGMFLIYKARKAFLRGAPLIDIPFIPL